MARSTLPLVALLLVGAACSGGQPRVTSIDAGSDGSDALDIRSDLTGEAIASDGGGPPSPDTGDAGIPADDATVAPDAPLPLRVLFVGNSYTYVNDLPTVVRALGATMPGTRVAVESITLGGATLADQWNTTGARTRIEMGGLDTVVMQGQSLEPVFSYEDFAYHASLFSGAMAQAGARGVWFATWARRAGDPIYATSGYDPASLSAMLELRYRMVAEVNAGDRVARVGAAWQLALAELPEVGLYLDDGSHPTPAGTLLAACVILQSITGETAAISDPPPVDLPLATAQALCAIAPRVRCFEGMGFCSGECVDLQYNPDHCGDCAVACDPMDPCQQGVCGCPPGQTGCARSCVDLLTDTQHCGSCQLSCQVGEVCSSGHCTCPQASVQAIDYANLALLDPGCTSKDQAGSVACNSAGNQLCAALGCFGSGVGPPSGHAPEVDAVLCVPDEVQTTTYSALATFVPACDGVTERGGQSCATAISRYCASIGAVSGFGPVAASSGDEVSVTCVKQATVVRSTLTEVGSFVSRCVPDPVTCSAGAWSFCTSLGHAGGFGPVEVADGDVDVVCLDP